MSDPIGGAPLPTEAPAAPAAPASAPEEALKPTLVDEALGDSQTQKEDVVEKKEVADVVPEKYELKMPEGIELDAAALELYSPIFKELGFTNEKLQALTDKVYVPLIQSVVDKTRQESMKEYDKMREEWKAETFKELGPNAKVEMAHVGKAMQKFGDADLRQFMKETGIGDHKTVIRLLAKVGKTISEDTFADGNQPAKVDPERIMYPSMFK